MFRQETKDEVKIMNEFLTALITGLATFTATNLDDIVILTLLFAQVIGTPPCKRQGVQGSPYDGGAFKLANSVRQSAPCEHSPSGACDAAEGTRSARPAAVNHVFRAWHIVVGQYLGFTVLVLVSLIGFWFGFMIPASLIRLLGLIPLGIGLLSLLKNEAEESDKFEIGSLKPQSNNNGVAWPILIVAAITIANGGDNLGIYIPLFANSSLQSLLIILSVFMTLLGIWCYAAYKLTHLPAIASLVTEYGNSFVPGLLIGLGVFIIKENIVMAILALGISYL